VAVAGSNGELRGGKYELYEGGIRVPCIVRWPGVTRAGAVVDTPSWFPDWMPTLSGGRSRDGVDLRTVLAGNGKKAERELFWKFEDRAVGTPLSFALRRGDWKLLRIGEATALYDLKSDAAERVDVARENPKVAAELSQRMKAWMDGLR
jgi:arylsulfatase A-like enzyme